LFDRFLVTFLTSEDTKNHKKSNLRHEYRSGLLTNRRDEGGIEVVFRESE
jgi:hypothetical protein